MLLKLLNAFSFLVISKNVIQGAEIISFDVPTKPSKMDCTKVKFSQEPNCLCVTGLWRFYPDCTTFNTIAGNSHCFQTKHVSYTMEILSDPRSIVMIRDKTNQVIHLNSENAGMHSLAPGDLIVTGSPHLLKTYRSSVCVFPQQDAFCTYQPREFLGNEKITVTAGCPEDFPYLSPLRCDYIKGSQTCEDARDLLEEKLLESQNEISVKGHKFEDKGPPMRQKRSLYPNIEGRAFLGSPDQQLDLVPDDVAVDDEDFMTLQARTDAKLTPDAILSEIWNYIEATVEVEMELRKKNEQEMNYGLPYFKLLQESKKVMQKICPEHYVPHKFFDIAVQSFIQVQIKRFTFDPPNANYPAFTRIIEALQLCAENMTTFPFLPLPPGEPGPVDPTGKDACDETKIGQGLYFIYNATMDLTVGKFYVGKQRDPIIETVWKIFSTAQSYCYPWFQEFGFNDHHRFTAWLTPVFQNEIHDIWLEGKATKDTYGKFLGDIDKVMEKVAYCAASSRLSKHPVEYPWELPIPPKMGQASLPPGSGPPPPPGSITTTTTDSTTSAGGQGGRRRKRESNVMTEPENPSKTVKCLSDKEISTCFSKARHISLYKNSKRSR